MVWAQGREGEGALTYMSSIGMCRSKDPPFSLRHPKGSGAFLMKIRPSSSSVVSVNFHLKYYIYILISQKRPYNFFRFWCTASSGRYPCTVKIWIWLNQPKGHFKRSERSNLAFYFKAIFSKTFYNFCFYLCKKLPKEGTNVLSKEGFY